MNIHNSGAANQAHHMQNLLPSASESNNNQTNSTAPITPIFGADNGSSRVAFLQSRRSMPANMQLRITTIRPSATFSTSLAAHGASNEYLRLGMDVLKEILNSKGHFDTVRSEWGAQTYTFEVPLDDVGDSRNNEGLGSVASHLNATAVFSPQGEIEGLIINNHPHLGMLVVGRPENTNPTWRLRDADSHNNNALTFSPQRDTRGNVMATRELHEALQHQESLLSPIRAEFNLFSEKSILLDAYSHFEQICKNNQALPFRESNGMYVHTFKTFTNLHVAAYVNADGILSGIAAAPNGQNWRSIGFQ